MRELKRPAATPTQPEAMSSGKLSPLERQQWADLYRIYERYAPPLRAAAKDTEQAAPIFAEAAKELASVYKAGTVGEVLSCQVYELLERIYTGC